MPGLHAFRPFEGRKGLASRHADFLLDDLVPTLTDDRALKSTALPTLSSHDRRPGIAWLIRNLGHAREHMGHLRLTVQLYDATFNRQS